MVRYSKKLGKKRTVIARKMHRKRGKKSVKSLRRSRLLKAERKRKRRKTKMRGGRNPADKQENSDAPADKSAKKYNNNQIDRFLDIMKIIYGKDSKNSKDRKKYEDLENAGNIPEDIMHRIYNRMQYSKMLVHIINHKDKYRDIYDRLGTEFNTIINSVVDVNQPGKQSNLSKKEMAAKMAAARRPEVNPPSGVVAGGSRPTRNPGRNPHIKVDGGRFVNGRYQPPQIVSVVEGTFNSLSSPSPVPTWHIPILENYVRMYRRFLNLDDPKWALTYKQKTNPINEVLLPGDLTGFENFNTKFSESGFGREDVNHPNKELVINIIKAIKSKTTNPGLSTTWMPEEEEREYKRTLPEQLVARRALIKAIEYQTPSISFILFGKLLPEIITKPIDEDRTSIVKKLCEEAANVVIKNSSPKVFEDQYQKWFVTKTELYPFPKKTGLLTSSLGVVAKVVRKIAKKKGSARPKVPNVTGLPPPPTPPLGLAPPDEVAPEGVDPDGEDPAGAPPAREQGRILVPIVDLGDEFELLETESLYPGSDAEYEEETDEERVQREAEFKSAMGALQQVRDAAREIEAQREAALEAERAAEEREAHEEAALQSKAKTIKEQHPEAPLQINGTDVVYENLRAEEIIALHNKEEIINNLVEFLKLNNVNTAENKHVIDFIDEILNTKFRNYAYRFFAEKDKIEEEAIQELIKFIEIKKAKPPPIPTRRRKDPGAAQPIPARRRTDPGAAPPIPARRRKDQVAAPRSDMSLAPLESDELRDAARDLMRHEYLTMPKPNHPESTRTRTRLDELTNAADGLDKALIDLLNLQQTQQDSLEAAEEAFNKARRNFSTKLTATATPTVIKDARVICVDPGDVYDENEAPVTVQLGEPLMVLYYDPSDRYCLVQSYENQRFYYQTRYLNMTGLM